MCSEQILMPYPEQDSHIEAVPKEPYHRPFPHLLGFAMSAAPVTPRAIDCVPPEIWLITFAHVFPPGTFETAPLDPAMSHDTRAGLPDSEGMHDARRTLHAAALVSRTWRWPATDALYSALYLNTVEAVDALHATLTAHPALGARTRHVNVTPPHFLLNTRGPTSTIPRLARLLSLMPSLRIFSVMLRHKMGLPSARARWLSAPLCALPRTLRKLALVGITCADVAPEALGAVLARTPGLRALVLLGEPSYAPGLPRLPRLPQLAFLRVGPGVCAPDAWPAGDAPAFPALTHLYIDPHAHLDAPAPDLLLAVRQGALVTTVTLDYASGAPGASRPLRETVFGARATLAPLWAALPRVTRVRIVVPLGDFRVDAPCAQMLRHAALPASVTHVAVCVVGTPPRRTPRPARVLGHVARMLAILDAAGVRVVQFVQREYNAWMRTMAAKHCAARSGGEFEARVGQLRIEDCEGAELCVVPKDWMA
jgi:hypothetical protein